VTNDTDKLFISREACIKLVSPLKGTTTPLWQPHLLAAITILQRNLSKLHGINLYHSLVILTPLVMPQASITTLKTN